VITKGIYRSSLYPNLWGICLKEASKEPIPKMGFARKGGSGFWFSKVSNLQNMVWIGPIELGAWQE
jgi:hypothetical protein